MIPKTMKACMLTANNTFAMRELPVPQPEPGEVLCRIRAIAICGTDPEIIKGKHVSKGWPPRYPFVMGHEWSGEVVQVGKGVTEFNEGDRVAGDAHRGVVPAETAWKETILSVSTTESQRRGIGTTGSSPRERIVNTTHTR